VVEVSVKVAQSGRETCSYDTAIIGAKMVLGITAMQAHVMRRAVEDLLQLYKDLSLEPEVWERDGARRSPYRTLLVMGLSPQARDDQLTKSCRQLFESYPSPSYLLKAWRGQRSKVMGIIQQLGNLRNKVRFMESAVALIQQYGTAIPYDRQLLSAGGIGNKVAECMIGYGYGKPALPVDGHVCRVVFLTCGLSFQYDPAFYAPYIRDQLKRVFEPSKWMRTHEILRLHGQAVCGKEPRCSWCPVSNCSFRQKGYTESVEVARLSAMKVMASWEAWRELLLEPQ
jgi:endonuclease III